MIDTLFANGTLTNTGMLVAGVIGLLLLVVLVIRLGRRRRRHAYENVGGHRLAILDQVPIDETRRLVLIERDDVQHLVILGGGSDFLVEAGIRRAGAQPAVATTPAPATEAPRPPMPVAEARPAPRPLVEHPVHNEPDVPPAVISQIRAEQVRPAPAPFETVTLEEPILDIPPRPATRPDPVAEMQISRPGTGNGRVSVKLDPHFAGMIDQLDSGVRRPASHDAPPAPTINATPIIDAAPAPTTRAAPVLGPATPAPSHAEAPEVQPAARPAASDADFDSEMASLLGRNRRL